MNKFWEEYGNKKRTLEQIYDYVEDGDSIISSIAAMEPVTFYSKLHTIANRIHEIHVNNTLSTTASEYMMNPIYKDKFKLWSWFLLGPVRKLYAEGRVEYIPGHLHNAAPRYVQDKQADVFVCTVGAMDDYGYFQCSLSNVIEGTFIKNAKKVILEVNPQVPFSYGESRIHISEVTALFETNRPLPVIPDAQISEVDRKIGVNVAELVNDGDTIQLGIGSIPDAVAKSFVDKKDLGLHTELITNSVVELFEKGVLTGSKKTLHPGRMVGTFAFGNQKLYDFIDRNPNVLILPGTYVNDPNVIAQNDNMVSINTAISVDFFGQVCSESIGARQISGSGGQNDTAEGAIHARNGRAIIAMTSTAKGGTVSTITPCLPLGSIVTLSRNNLDYVVTEYGIAKIKNKTISERTRNLINIAHPDFRDRLIYEAKKIMLI